MKVYKTNEEVKADVKNGVLKINGDVKFECDIEIDAHIDALNIDALDIDAWDIDAWDINASNIEARNINYYAFCIAYNNIKCESIKGKRARSFHKCLDGELIIKENQPEIEITVKINGKEAKLSDISDETLKKMREN